MNQENILEVFSQDNNIGDDNNPETCIICSKSYKTKGGLVQHENKKHFEYHEYPLNIPSPPQYYLTEFKKNLIYNIKKKLTLHHKSLGKKTLTIPCSEGMFLGIFRVDFKRYSPARRFYLSSFVGEEGDERLGNLFDDKDWSIRYFDNNQYVYVDIVNFEVKVVWKEEVK
ncbi:9083_t:CDS:2 [Entrophospora sp. SA101]|nr:9083_t:CDS:2 [Entrophospora sp. SA101]